MSGPSFWCRSRREARSHRRDVESFMADPARHLRRGGRGEEQVALAAARRASTSSDGDDRERQVRVRSRAGRPAARPSAERQQTPPSDAAHEARGATGARSPVISRAARLPTGGCRSPQVAEDGRFGERA